LIWFLRHRRAGMQIGYARVSTQEQDLQLQLDALSVAGCERVFQEKASGKNLRRPELHRALDMLRDGDVLVCYKPGRLARSLKDLLEIISRLEASGAGLRCTAAPVDTTTPAGRMMLSMLGAVAEFERETLIERTRDGLAAARAQGRVGGRPRALDEKKRQALVDLRETGRSVAELMELFSVSRATVYRVLREAGEVGSTPSSE
jgi:DNA invertase Pin-like site-specific DNA recombinase